VRVEGRSAGFAHFSQAHAFVGKPRLSAIKEEEQRQAKAAEVEAKLKAAARFMDWFFACAALCLASAAF